MKVHLHFLIDVSPTWVWDYIDLLKAFEYIRIYNELHELVVPDFEVNWGLHWPEEHIVKHMEASNSKWVSDPSLNQVWSMIYLSRNEEHIVKHLKQKEASNSNECLTQV